VALVIVIIGAICNYYFGAIGAVLSALVVVASLSKSRANAILPSILLIGLSWWAGSLIADDYGAPIGVLLATAFALWLEARGKIVIPGIRRPRMSSRDSARS
jgi:hypothetical protein